MTPVGGGKGIEADLAVVHHVVGQPGQRLRDAREHRAAKLTRHRSRTSESLVLRCL
jgi:hypothetical protein